MAEQTAKIILEASLSKLKATMTKAQGLVTRSLVKMHTKVKASMSKALASTGKLLKNLTGGLLKFGALGAAALAGFSIKAAMEQEKADKLLAASLKNVGDASKETFKDLKNYAGAIQELTTFGDETIQQTMALGLNMGISKDAIKETTKGAIGLSKAFGIDLNSSMKMVALATQGDFNMLQRYIPELKGAATESEKLAIVNKAMADGFSIAQAEAETSAGKMQQFKNTMGDVAEKIGQALLPAISDAFTSMKNWLDKNGDDVKRWAENTVSFMTKAATGFSIFLEKARNMAAKIAFVFIQIGEAMAGNFSALGSIGDGLDQLQKESEDRLKKIQEGAVNSNKKTNEAIKKNEASKFKAITINAKAAARIAGKAKAKEDKAAEAAAKKVEAQKKKQEQKQKSKSSLLKFVSTEGSSRFIGSGQGLGLPSIPSSVPVPSGATPTAVASSNSNKTTELSILKQILQFIQTLPQELDNNNTVTT